MLCDSQGRRSTEGARARGAVSSVRPRLRVSETGRVRASEASTVCMGGVRVCGTGLRDRCEFARSQSASDARQVQPQARTRAAHAAAQLASARVRVAWQYAVCCTHCIPSDDSPNVPCLLTCVGYWHDSGRLRIGSIACRCVRRLHRCAPGGSEGWERGGVRWRGGARAAIKLRGRWRRGSSRSRAKGEGAQERAKTTGLTGCCVVGSQACRSGCDQAQQGLGHGPWTTGVQSTPGPRMYHAPLARVGRFTSAQPARPAHPFATRGACEHP